MTEVELDHVQIAAPKGRRQSARLLPVTMIAARIARRHHHSLIGPA